MERMFGLDIQLGFDVILQAVCVLLLFAFLSYMLFNPVRKILENRKERVKHDVESAAKDRVEGDKYKSEYQNRIAGINKEADAILSEARKKAMKREEDIVAEAKAEAQRIIDRANSEVELEKKRVRDEVKQEMIEIAAAMAGKILASSIDASKQAALFEDTLKEMGDDTWLS